jgi:hypothetical protein
MKGSALVRTILLVISITSASAFVFAELMALTNSWNVATEKVAITASRKSVKFSKTSAGWGCQIVRQLP